MAFTGKGDKIMSKGDEAMLDNDQDEDLTSYSLNDDLADDYVAPVDFSDTNFDRRTGVRDRRSTFLNDRRRQDRRRASRHSDESEKLLKSRTSVDPMNIYLREMGTLTLLNHEEELKLAQMMETGKQRVQNAVLQTPLAIPVLQEVVKGLDKQNDKICQIISGITENKPSIIKRESREFLERVEQAVVLNKDREELLADYLKLYREGNYSEADKVLGEIGRIGAAVRDLFQDKIICAECIRAIAEGLEELSRRFRKVFVEIMGAHVASEGTPPLDVPPEAIEQQVNQQIMEESGVDEKQLRMIISFGHLFSLLQQYSIQWVRGFIPDRIFIDHSYKPGFKTMRIDQFIYFVHQVLMDNVLISLTRHY